MYGIVGVAHDGEIYCPKCAKRLFGSVAVQVLTEDDVPPAGGEEGYYAVFDHQWTDTPLSCGDCLRYLPCTLTTDGDIYVFEALVALPPEEQQEHAWYKMFPYLQNSQVLDFINAEKGTTYRYNPETRAFEE
jgi:hypothetical protein